MTDFEELGQAGSATMFEPIAVSDESTVVATYQFEAAGNDAYQSEAALEDAFIAQLVAQGFSNKDVAEACWISPMTVAFHLRNVFAKTGVTSRSELAHLGLA